MNEENEFIKLNINGNEEKIPSEKVSELYEKGIKFEIIEKNYQRLITLADKNNLSIEAYITSLENSLIEAKNKNIDDLCGENEELKNYIKKLEEKQNIFDNGLSEIKAYFPEFQDESDLPSIVFEASKLNRRSLLDEFLRYKLKNYSLSKSQMKTREKAKNSSVGSQLDYNYNLNPEAGEFIKGLWK